MKILMHLCCAPCGVYPVASMRDEGHQVDGYFYNPNIHPLEEYQRRLDTVHEYAQKVNLHVDVAQGFMQREWEQFTGCTDQRCRMCYGMRMDRAAKAAKLGGYDAFTTSLLVSPYQKHDFIREIAQQAAVRNDVAFEYRDFRDGFRQGQQMAREMGLYRQKYCACIYSYQERQQQEAEKLQRKLERQAATVKATLAKEATS